MPPISMREVANEDTDLPLLSLHIDDTEDATSRSSDSGIGPLSGTRTDESDSTEETEEFPYGLMAYYVFHGMLDELPSTAVYLVLKNHFQISPDKYSFFLSMDWIPWVLKPVFGYVSDRYPIRGRRRTPYITLGIVLNTFGWTLLCSTALIDVPGSTFMIIYFLNSLTFVMHETAVDSLLAELSRVEPESEMGLLQSLHWTCDAAGSVMGTIIPIVAFWDGFSASTVLMITTGVVASSLLVLPWIPEPIIRTSILSSRTIATPACSNTPSLVNEEIKACFQNPVLRRSLIFVFLVSSPTTSGDAFTYFQTDVLHFSPAFLSFSAVLSTAANFLAAYAYATWLRKWNMRSIFCYSILFMMATGLANIVVVKRWNRALGVPDHLFVIGDTVAQGVASEVIFMPVAVLAARLAPQGLEGTAYAICLSVLNLSWAVSELSSGILSRLFGVASPDHYENLPAQIVVVALLTLVPLAFLHCVPDLGGPASEDEEQGREDDDDDSVSNLPPTRQ